MAGVLIEGQARVSLAHACIQALAEERGIALLHVKGPALDPSLRHPGRISTDADVLVRPGQVAALTDALMEHGWTLVTGFASGSFFEHAANYHHLDWGYVDVHREFPGITLDVAAAFERLWVSRTSARIAHIPCPVPAVRDQALLLCLHAARGKGGSRAASDLEQAWHGADDAQRAALRERAGELGAGVALAAALGELAGHDDRTVDLWRFYSQGGSRMDEWLARFKAAPTRRAALRTALRGLGVNREFAAMQLGREPSVRELVVLFLGRYVTGSRQLVGRLLGRAPEETQPGGDR